MWETKRRRSWSDESGEIGKEADGVGRFANGIERRIEIEWHGWPDTIAPSGPKVSQDLAVHLGMELYAEGTVTQGESLNRRVGITSEQGCIGREREDRVLVAFNDAQRRREAGKQTALMPGGSQRNIRKANFPTRWVTLHFSSEGAAEKLVPKTDAEDWLPAIDCDAEQTDEADDGGFVAPGVTG